MFFVYFWQRVLVTPTSFEFPMQLRLTRVQCAGIKGCCILCFIISILQSYLSFLPYLFKSVSPCLEEVAETKHNQAHTKLEAEISGSIVKKLRACIAGWTLAIVPRAELYPPSLVFFLHAVRLVTSPTGTDLHFLI